MKNILEDIEVLRVDGFARAVPGFFLERENIDGEFNAKRDGVCVGREKVETAHVAVTHRMAKYQGCLKRFWIFGFGENVSVYLEQTLCCEVIVTKNGKTSYLKNILVCGIFKDGSSYLFITIGRISRLL